MKRFLTLILICLMALPASAAGLIDIIAKGTVNHGVTIRIIDSGDGTPETGVAYDTAGIDLWYRRQGATKVSLTEAELTALDDAHSDGGVLHIGDGEYRLDLPDAALAAGADYVDVGGTVTGMVVIGGRVRLTGLDLDDADGSTLTEAGGDGDHLVEAGGTGDQLTAIDLPNQTMDITGSLSGSVGSVTGAVGSVTGNVGGNVTGTVASVVADAAQGRNAIRTGTAQSGGSGAIQLDAGASAVNDFYNGCLIYITGGTGAGQVRLILDYNGTSKFVTTTVWETDPDNTSTFAILPVGLAWVDFINSNVVTAGSIATDAIGASEIAANAIGSSELATTAAQEIRDAILSDSTPFAGAAVTEARLAELDAANLPADLDAVLADTAELQTDLADGGRLDLLIDAILANTALLETAHAEPTGVPAANASPLDKLAYIYAALRNKVEVTASKKKFYDDADAPLWEKDLSDDGTTYQETEANAP